ncbi:hypothetical protein [Halobacillus sp. Cin3]|nr:hypothetical protein [Halobacillus sp. Cin3]
MLYKKDNVILKAKNDGEAKELELQGYKKVTEEDLKAKKDTKKAPSK